MLKKRRARVMKRVNELDLLAEEIVEDANARDGEGRLLHPVMGMPLATMIFHAKDALI